MIDKKTIIDFGVPDNLKNLDLKFCFDDELADADIVGSGCHCDARGAKFFLYYTTEFQCIFTMDFYVTDENNFNNMFSHSKIYERRIHLQHIQTNSAFRKQGIASFYIRKLTNFCSHNDIHVITLDLCPFSEDTSHMLNRDELTKFYNSFSTDDVKIHIV